MSKAVNKKQKRDETGKYRSQQPAGLVFGLWIVSFVSLGLVWLVSRAVLSDFGSFRKCDGGTGISSIASCGKQSINVTDFALIGLLGLACALSASLLIASWRMTKKGKVIV